MASEFAKKHRITLDSTTEVIGIYNPDGTLSPVKPDPLPMGNANAGKLGADATPLTAQFIANTVDFDGAKLCNLFFEAAP